MIPIAAATCFQKYHQWGLAESTIFSPGIRSNCEAAIAGFYFTT